MEMLPAAAPGRRVYAPVMETVDGREPSRRIALQTESVSYTSGTHGPERDLEYLTETEARDAARDVALADYPRTIGPGSEASCDRAVDVYGRAGQEVRSRPLGYPLKAGVGPWLDAGTGASPTVMYPSGAGTILGSQYADPPPARR